MDKKNIPVIAEIRSMPENINDDIYRFLPGIKMCITEYYNKAGTLLLKGVRNGKIAVILSEQLQLKLVGMGYSLEEIEKIYDYTDELKSRLLELRE